VREVAQGNQYLSPKLVERFQTSGRNIANTLSDASATLTLRELEILQMVAEGRTSLEIGNKLTISPRTVEVHRGHLMKKLGLRNQIDLIRFAIKRGILPMDD